MQYFLLILIALFPILNKSEISVQKKQANGTNYTFFSIKLGKILLADKRPSKNDELILLSVPAAYTTLDGGIDGAFLTNTRGSQFNMRLKGMLLVFNDSIVILKTPTDSSGKANLLHNSAFNYFFQQTLLLKDGLIEPIQDEKHFQRRAVAIFKNNSYAIVESDRAITLAQFAADLKQLGAKDLLNLDMGSYDEGWY